MHLLSPIVIYFTVLIKVAEGAGLPVTGYVISEVDQPDVVVFLKF